MKAGRREGSWGSKKPYAGATPAGVLAFSVCAVCVLALLACDPEVLVGRASPRPNVDASGSGGNSAGSSGSSHPGGSSGSGDVTVMDGGGRDAGPDAAPIDAGIDAARDAAPDAEVDAGTPTPGPRSQLAWHSGAHTGNELATQAAFEVFRGRPLDLSMYFVDRTQGWPGLVAPQWLIDLTEPLDTRLILSIPLYPEDGSNQECASDPTGAYRSEWRKLGPFLARNGRGDSIIRLGWGPNDDRHYWKADADPRDWIACFQRAAAAIRETGPNLEIAWDFDDDAAFDSTALDPYSAYPGDDYVDYIGLEAFDMAPPVRDEAAWEAKCNSPAGLCKVIEFARAHGKRVGVSEWSVVSCYDDTVAQNGGDNPFYIEKMFETFAANAGVMGFEVYYQNGGEVCSVLSTGNEHPNSAAKYRELYRQP